MTRDANLRYRRNCPYDAMGDYSFLIDQTNQKRDKEKKTVPNKTMRKRLEARIENGQAVKGVSAPVKKNGRVGNFFCCLFWSS